MELRLWSDLGQATGALVATVIVYLVVLVAVRVAGRRTTAQLSAYDTLVTVALGTSLATTALPAHPAVADGLVVLATLLALQLLIGALRQRSAAVRRAVDFAPEVVVAEGELRQGRTLLSAQLTAGEIESQLRRNGVRDTDDVVVMVLEPGGAFSVRTGDEAEPPPLWRRL